MDHGDGCNKHNTNGNSSSDGKLMTFVAQVKYMGALNLKLAD